MAANIRFCEPKHTHHPAIAEFHNTWSSLTYVALGLWAVSCVKGSRTPALALISIGVGSAIFHATLQRWSEWLDEGSMLFFANACLHQLIRHLRARDPADLDIACGALSCTNLLLFGHYMRSNSFAAFLHQFTLQLVVMVGLVCCGWRGSRVFRPRAHRAFRHRSGQCARMLAYIITGRVAWELEQQLTNSGRLFDWRTSADPALCADTTLLHWWHVVWHALSALAALEMVLLLDALNSNGLRSRGEG